MDKLVSILGRNVIKPEDFKIGSDGSVTSGRPLTQRRINAIVHKATVIGKSDFSIDTYRIKLEAIKAELGLAGLSDKELKAAVAKNPSLAMFVHADKCLDFLKNEIVLGHKVIDPSDNSEKMVYGKDESDIDPSVIRNHPEYAFLKGFGEEKGVPKFQYKDPATGDYKDFKSTSDWNNTYLFKRLGGEFLHLERADFKTKDSDDIEPLKKYIHDNVQLFVQKMVDVYMEAKELGKTDELMVHLTNPGACLEDKCLHLVQFQNKIAPKEDLKPMEAGEAAELERIANMDISKNAPPPKGESLIYDAIDALNKSSEKLNESENWKDFEAQVKEKLIGKTAAITKPVKNDKGIYEFEPVLKNGKPLVRPLTAEDIDAIGKACLYNIVNI